MSRFAIEDDETGRFDDRRDFCEDCTHEIAACVCPPATDYWALAVAITKAHAEILGVTPPKGNR